MRHWWREIVRFFVEGLLDDPDQQPIAAEMAARRQRT
jgi:hypothetical protein